MVCIIIFYIVFYSICTCSDFQNDVKIIVELQRDSIMSFVQNLIHHANKDNNDFGLIWIRRRCTNLDKKTIDYLVKLAIT